MRILFLSAWHPFPPDNGARMRIYNLLVGLSKYHEITLLTFADEEHINQESQLKKICEAVHVLPKKRYEASSRRALLGLFGKKPRMLADLYSKDMDRMIQDELSTGNHDLIIASEIYMADYLKRIDSLPMIFEEAEVGVFTDAARLSTNFLKRIRYHLTLLKLKSYFQEVLPEFAYCTVVSGNEKDLLQELVPEYESIVVIPNGVSLRNYQEISEEPRKNSLIFTGALTFSPNLYAMQWFTEQVFPRILEFVPETQLTITGDRGGYALDNDLNVNFTGYVDDVRPLIASSWISLAPIFSGGGTRLKILEAFGLRTPVVATTKGAEGLEVRHGEHLLIADTADSFPEEILRLLEGAELRQKLVDNAYQLVREKYDWEVIVPKFQSLIESVV